MELLHHLRAALVIGSIVTLLHAAGLLGSVDAFTSRLIGTAGPAWQGAAVPSDDLPLVALIGPGLFEHDFAQSSPLAPAGMARLIAGIPTTPPARPALVVVDLDLSPGISDAADSGRTSLDASLRRLVASGIDVVLPLPIRVASTDLQDVKFDWMRRICGWNAAAQPHGRVAFGHSDVATHQGAVLQFDPRQPSIGMVAAGATAGASLCDRALEPSGRWKAALVGSQFRDADLPSGDEHEPMRPFNARFFGEERRVVRTVETLDDPFGPDARRMGARAIFIGAGFNAQDRFYMPLVDATHSIEGVVVHAATYFSALHPVSVPSGLSTYALDVILGVAMGYWFTWLWHWHLDVKGRSGRRRGLLAHWSPRASLLTNFAVAGGTAAFALLLAELFFFPLNLWVNPVPIVLGVFAKFVVASRAGHVEGHAPTHGEGAHATKTDAWRHRVDAVLFALLIATALFTASRGHH